MDFTITLMPSGRQFTCGNDADILRAGLNSGAGLHYSCRSGVCKTCRGKVVQGRVDLGNVNSHYLSDSEREQGYAHLCCAKPQSDCTIEVNEYDPALTRPSRMYPARVLSADKLAPDVMKLVINLPPNDPVVSRAGQYLDIVLKDGVRRSYSIANMPIAEGLRQFELHIRHLPGGVFTDHVFSALKVRDMLRVDVARGTFFLDETDTRPIVMLATGTGFAPIKSMIEKSLEVGMTNPIRFYWGGRRKKDLYMHEQALQWAADHSHIEYIPVLSEATAEDAWTGRTGFVHQAVLADLPDMSSWRVYACGAPPMIEAASRDFGAMASLPADQFLSDAFISEADKAMANKE